MVDTFFANQVYSNLNSILNIFERNNDVMSIFGQQKRLTMEIELWDFLKTLAI